VLPPFCISVSDPYKPSMEKLAAEGVIAYDTNGQVAEVREEKRVGANTPAPIHSTSPPQNKQTPQTKPPQFPPKPP
jgi:hypothetical protein